MQVKKIVGTITIAGAGVLLVNSVLQLTKSDSVKSAVLPILGVLVSFSAIQYSINDMNAKTLEQKLKPEAL